MLDELLGRGFAVLGMGVDPTPYFDTFVDKLPICTFEIAADEMGQIQDHTGKLAAWFAEQKADFVVLRPDRFVFGVYSVENVVQAVDELSVQLALSL